MSFIYSHPGENRVAAITPSFSTGAAASGSSVANLIDGSPAKGLLTNATTIRLVWDLGSALAIEAAFFFNVNWSGGTAALEAHTADSWGAPDISTAITLPTLGGDGFYTNPWIDRSALAAKRYISLVVSSNASNVFIGEVWFASSLRTLAKFQQEATVLMGGDTVLHQTNYGTSLAYSRGNRRAQIDGEVLASTSSGLPALQAWGQAAQWRARPFPIVLDSTVNQAEFVRWNQDDLSPVYRGPLLTRVPVSWLSEGRGVAA